MMHMMEKKPSYLLSQHVQRRKGWRGGESKEDPSKRQIKDFLMQIFELNH